MVACVDYFKNNVSILLATEAAAEGINLQFCSLVVNYDLPWNPQRIEQRIGRCHRYGQKYDVVVVNFLNKKNAADQRVYQILAGKFRLFDGVFGTSDEVLGNIESGIEFEKRIVQIYQTCRTEAEIQACFDALQQEMEAQIDEKINLTRQKLLENFDEEVIEKLKINLQESRDYLNKYENQLWELTKFYLDSYADFSLDDHAFILLQNPFPLENINIGKYRLGKNIDDSNIYRIGHPLAQNIIENCKSLSCLEKEIIFNYSDTPKKISILEPFIHKSGWLCLINLTIDSLEPEDRILFCGITDDGIDLDVEQCKRLFSLPASLNSLENKTTNEIREKLNQIAYTQEAEFIQINTQRNSVFFDDEMGKLDKWAEDLKSSMEIELKELDKEIKFRKTESRKILKLEEKLKAQREIKEMEKKRNHLRLNLYNAQDEIDKRKENLIEKIEARLKQKIEKEELFLVKWKMI